MKLPAIILFASLGILYGQSFAAEAPVNKNSGQPKAKADTKKAAADALWRVATPAELPLEEQVVSKREENGIAWKEFYFTSEKEGADAFRIFSIYAAPKQPGKTAAILFIHGGGGTADPTVVKYWAEQGYACLSFDHTGNPEGKTDRKEFSRFGAGTELKLIDSIFGVPPMESRVRHAQIAASRAIHWLQAQSEVDPDKIGVEGWSWGGFHSLLLAGLDERVKAVVNVYGTGFWFEHPEIAGGAFGLTGSLILQPVEKRAEWLAAFDPGHYIPKIKAPVFFMSGTHDMFFWLPLLSRSYDATSSEKRLWLVPNINHTFRPATIQQVAKPWFDYYLKGKGELLPQVQAIAVSGQDVQFSLSAPAKGIRKPELHYLWLDKDPKGGGIGLFVSKDLVWQAVVAEFRAGSYQVRIPAGGPNAKVVAVYGAIETADGILISSPVKVLQAGTFSEVDLNSRH